MIAHFNRRSTLTSARFPTGITAADLNADGKLDLIVGNYINENVEQVLLGRGDGTFSPPTNYTVFGSAFNSKVGDLNGDGKQDILVSGISLLLGNGDLVSSRAPPTTAALA